jgi:hypothetical protein
MTESDGPIVAAVRQARAKIAAECRYDWARLAERLRKIEAEHPDRLRPRKPGLRASCTEPRNPSSP